MGVAPQLLGLQACKRPKNLGKVLPGAGGLHGRAEGVLWRWKQ